MSLADAKSLQRTAQRLIVEARKGSGSPPAYEANWQPVWGASIDRIIINAGAKPSSALIWFPDLRWDASAGLGFADMVRIRTFEGAVLFAGFIVGRKPAFGGGTEKGGAFERNVIHLADYRWLISAGSALYGQFGRGPDDYYSYGSSSQEAIGNSYTRFTGRRTVFNQDGRPNRDPVLLNIENSAGVHLCNISIFADPEIGKYWTAREMIIYCLSPLWNSAYEYFPLDDPSSLLGLDHTDFDKVLNHVSVEGLNIIEAVSHICSQLGWSLREEYYRDGSVSVIFYKFGSAVSFARGETEPIILHRLYAPAAGESIAAPVAAGEKMLWSMELDEDITKVVNAPIGLGAPDRFEFTAELVPAWRNTRLAPDTSDDNKNLFFTEADLQDITEPNLKSYFKYYHPRGSQFRHEVGRKWTLNETGRYSLDPYDRGKPFDFAAIIPEKYIKDSGGKRLFGPFARQLLTALSEDPEGVNTIGIKVEFSFDGGESWQLIPAAIVSLEKEAGVYIAEANLAEMVDQKERVIDGGDLDGVQLNFWSSLCDDRLAGSAFDDGQWLTRVRVTATVQMDQRLVGYAYPSWASGSPFEHREIYDFSDRYGIVKRTESSILSGLPAYQMDMTGILLSHLDSVRRANEDMSISGLFTLDRLWLGDGSGFPEFMPGDCLEAIDGRCYNLTVSLGSKLLHPEIVQIVYLPEKQKQQLVTRDLRFVNIERES